MPKTQETGGALIKHLVTEPWYRSRSGRALAGICMGLAARFHLSVTIVRLAFVLATFLAGSGIVLYLALWLIMPLEPFLRRYDADGNPMNP